MDNFGDDLDAVGGGDSLNRDALAHGWPIRYRKPFVGAADRARNPAT